MEQVDSDVIAEQLGDESYFALSRRWYSELFHTPMGQRSYYIILILMALLNMYFAILSFLGVFPIIVPVPFIAYSNNIWEEIPHIQRISSDNLEDKNVSVMKFFLRSYVENRETYDLPFFELRYRNIWSQSTKDVFEEYKRQIDASNPYSFYRQFTNRSRRTIDILALDFDRGQTTSQAHVTFEAHLISLTDGQEVAHSRWRADFTYKYTDFFVDQSLESNNPIAKFFGLTGNSLKVSGEKRKVVPMTFLVSDYKVKELLE